MAGTGLEVRIREGRERAEVSQFTQTLNSIVLSLREIDQVYLLRGTRATWVLDDLTHVQNDLVARLQPRNVPSGRNAADMMVPVEALVAGAEVLQATATVPELFAPNTVTRLAKLATPTVGVQTVSIARYNGQPAVPVELDDAVKSNATAAVHPSEIAYGSVTGALWELRKVRRGKSVGARVIIRDEIGRQAVTGHVGEAMVDQLRELWGHRVTVGGIIERNANGQAIRIAIDRIAPMPETNAGRATVHELLGAYAGTLTSDQIAEHLDQMRRG